MAVRPQLAALHLCAGYGGFELALRGIARTVAHIERDSYAAATLVARMAEARLDQAPVWSNLCTFDGGPWRGRVDLVTAGFPCQPFSAAGKRAGTDDDRWLWPEIARIVGDVRPRYVFLENVPGVVRHGLPHVLADLAALGFDAEWGLLSASAVGAPHKRERFWLVAQSNSQGLQGRGIRQYQPAEPGKFVADPVCARGQRVAWTQCPDGDARATGRRFPPRPDDGAGWAEWISNGGPEPSIRRGADGATDWLADALHLGGNGLVPQCAREAWLQLTERGDWS